MKALLCSYISIILVSILWMFGNIQAGGRRIKLKVLVPKELQNKTSVLKNYISNENAHKLPQ